MRKKIISICVLLPLLLSVGVISLLVMQRGTENCLALIEAARVQADAGDIAAAGAYVREAEDDFERNKGVMCLFVEHSLVDQVQLMFQLAHNGVNNNAASELLESLATLSNALLHLNHHDDITLINIV